MSILYNHLAVVPQTIDNTAGPTRDRSIGEHTFKRIFRGHPAAVVVITVDSGSGPVGFTATSLASLSAEPPLVSFGVNTKSSSWPHVRVSRTALVHFLGRQHEQLARDFATSGIDRFATTAWSRLPTGEPLLAGTAGWIRLRLQHQLAAGDSHLVIGEVIAAEPPASHDSDTASSPLLYLQGAYGAL